MGLRGFGRKARRETQAEAEGRRRAESVIADFQADRISPSEAEEGLTDIGDAAFEPLMAAFRGNDSRLRSRLAMMLSGTPVHDRIREHLIADLEGQDASETEFGPERAAEALGTISGHPTIEALGRALLNVAPEVRRSAAKSLGNFGTDRVYELLNAARETDEDEGVREIAATVLRNDIEALLSRLRDDASERAMSERAFAYDEDVAEDFVKMGEAAVEPLLKAFEDEDEDAFVRVTVAEALGEIGDSRAVEALAAGLQDEDAWVSKYATEALGKIDDARAVQPLIAAVMNEEPNWKAAWALGEIGDPGAVEPLSTALLTAVQEDDPRMRPDAADALGRLGDARAFDSLLASLQRDGIGRLQAARALGKIGDLRAVEPLIAVLQEGTPLVDRDETLRKFVAEALGELRDPRAVEPLSAALQEPVGHEDVRDAIVDALAKLDATV